MKSEQPRKQRKAMYSAPLHTKRKAIAAHLEESLLLKYDRRSISVVKGDTVKVMRGSYKGHEDKIARVNVKKNQLDIEGVTMMKADGTKIAKPVHPSNVIITKLNLTDKWRRGVLERKVSEETKKTIEQEAAQQLKEQEAERKRQEEEQKKLEEEAKKAAEETSEEPSEDIPEEQPAEKKTEETKPVKQEKPAPIKDNVEPKTATEKKPATTKKTAAKPSPEKKTPAKQEEKPPKKEEKA